MEQLGESGQHVCPLFVTVDPGRDSAELLANHVMAFHPRMVGLTGSHEQVASTAREYGVEYTVVEVGDQYFCQS
jgi:cytochrome oxidase Cu insertion factor (SCO1/SenC/PrrC family)